MEFYNEFKFEFGSHEDAVKAFEPIKRALLDSSNWNFASNYTQKFNENMANDIVVEDEVVVLNNKCYLTAYDAKRFFEELLNTLGDTIPDYKFINGNNDTYENSFIDAVKKDGELVVNVEYYPEGYWNTAMCDGCGYEFDRDDWNGEATTICPMCGEEIKLAEAFDVNDEYNHLEYKLNKGDK